MGKPIDERASSGTTQACFRQALLEIMKRKDFEKISVSEVAKAAGASRRAFYYYYDSIYGLVFDCYTTSCAPDFPNCPKAAQDPRVVDWLTENTKRHLEFFKENPQLARVIYRNYLSSPYLAKLEDELASQIRKHFEFVYDLPDPHNDEEERLRDEVSRYVFFGNQFYIKRWIESGMIDPIQTVAERIVRTGYCVGQQLQTTVYGDN